MGYFYILGCVFFTVYGQLIIKWRVSEQGALPEVLLDKLVFLVKLVFDPYIFSGFVAAFLASMFWMAAMTRFPISYAYPFMSLAFVFVFAGSALFLGENFDGYKIAGTATIMLGIFILSRSNLGAG